MKKNTNAQQLIVYYSCFGPLKDYYEKSYRKILPSRNSHQTLIGELQTSPFLEEQKLGNNLENLRNLRNNADYNKKSQEFPIVLSKNKVEEIFSMLNYLKKHPLRLMKN